MNIMFLNTKFQFKAKLKKKKVSRPGFWKKEGGGGPFFIFFYFFFKILLYILKPILMFSDVKFWIFIVKN